MTAQTGKVTSSLSITLDGYLAGLNQTEDRPFGDDGGDGWGNRLHDWMFDHPDENREEIDRLALAGTFIVRARDIGDDTRAGTGVTLFGRS